MTHDLKSFRAALRSAGASTASHLRAHPAWLLSGALVILALLSAYSVGRSSMAAAARHDAEARRLSAVSAGVDRWTDRIQAAAPAESALWLESERALGAITSAGTDPTTIARLVAGRAEEAGITNLGLRLVDPDSVSPPPPLDVGEWRIRPGHSAVNASFAGDWSAIMGLLGSLPPQVAVGRVEVEPGPGSSRRASVLLRSLDIRSAPRPRPAWPDPSELDSLRRYLTPVGPAPSPDDYAAFIPALPGPAPRRPRTLDPVRDVRVSAILIAGDRRTAIIDDRSVRVGDRLGDGAVVLSIGRDHLVLRERNGSTRTLRVSPGP